MNSHYSVHCESNLLTTKYYIVNDVANFKMEVTKEMFNYIRELYFTGRDIEMARVCSNFEALAHSQSSEYCIVHAYGSENETFLIDDFSTNKRYKIDAKTYAYLAKLQRDCDVPGFKKKCKEIIDDAKRNKKPKEKVHIKKVIFEKPNTIVYWSDGDKTVVKCSKEDTFNPEQGLAMAILKKEHGPSYYSNIKKWVADA